MPDTASSGSPVPGGPSGLAPHGPPGALWHLSLVNDQLVPLQSPALCLDDAGVLTGLAVFESMRVDQGRIFAASDHWMRLNDGAARLGITAPGREAFESAIRKFLNATALRDCRLRITLSAGRSQPGSAPNPASAASGGEMFSIFAVPLPAVAPEIALVTAPWRRNAHSPLAGIKCAAWAENTLALRHAAQHGAGEAILLNTAGELCECAASNLFLVRTGVHDNPEILTPPLRSGCLPGITRAHVFRLAAELGISCTESVLMPDALLTATEVFITGTYRGVQPATSIDGRQLPAGPVAQSLRSALEGFRAGAAI